MVERLNEKKPRKILVVEDSSNWLNLLPRLFEKEGIKAVTAGSLQEAQKALEAGGFTEIVTDSLEGDWIDVVESAGRLPVKLLSGNASLQGEAEKRGVQFLDKGDFDIESLLKDPSKP